MKKNILIALVAVLFVGVSCDPTRIDTPFAGQTEATYFTTTAEFRSNLVTVYFYFNRLKTAYNLVIFLGLYLFYLLIISILEV